MLLASAAFSAPFAPQFTDGTSLLGLYALDGEFSAAVYGPAATTTNQTTTLTLQVKAPPGGRIVYGLAVFGYEHTAAGLNYGAFPYGSYCPASGQVCKQFLSSPPALNWASPLVMLAPPTVKAGFGAFFDSIITPNPWLRFPSSAPFSRANDYDWQGACFIGDETLARVDGITSSTSGASMVAITCPLLLHRADASIMIWLAASAVTPEGITRLTKYLPVTLTANATPLVSVCPTPTQAPIVSSPKDGDHVGPNFDVNGTAQPNAVVVISTDIIDANTGELLKSVPGHRHLPDPSGAFSLRIAAPRLPEELLRVVRYRIHVRSEGADFKSPETLVTVYPQAQASN